MKFAKQNKEVHIVEPEVAEVETVEVEEVKKPKLTRNAKIGIGVAVGAVTAFAASLLFKRKSDEDFTVFMDSYSGDDSDEDDDDSEDESDSEDKSDE